MKFAPSGAAQLSGRPRECFDGRITQRHDAERVLQSFVKFLY